MYLQLTNIVFRTPGGEVVLTDYGMSRIAEAGVGAMNYSDAGPPVDGTAHFFAPELVGGGRPNTYASDV